MSSSDKAWDIPYQACGSTHTLAETRSQIKKQFTTRWTEVAADIASHSHPRLSRAMIYAMENGQQLRPTMMGLSSQSLGMRAPVSAMVALECVHNYSLVHDDLPAMDDDNMRRGRPSTHSKFDDATAILTGDALLTLAFRLLTEEEGTHEGKVALLQSLAARAGEKWLVDGQVHDLYPLTNQDQQLHNDARRTTARKKTSSLFIFAAEAPAILSGMPKQHPRREALVRYGELFGLAYQYYDDFRDEENKDDFLLTSIEHFLDKAEETLLPWTDQSHGLIALLQWLRRSTRG